MNKIIEWIYSHRWVIRPETLEAIIEIVNTKVIDNLDTELFHGKKLDFEKEGIDVILAEQGRRPDNTRVTAVRDSVAIINVIGVLCPRTSLFTMSGGVALSTLAKDLQVMLETEEIESIIMNIDSPGGEITGMSEFSDMLFASRAKKKVISYISGIAASGGYWIGSAASELIATEVSEAGSIGVVASYVSTKERDKKQGIERIEIISSLSPGKRPDLTTDAGKAQIQKVVDELAVIFINHLARNRGTDFENVANNFGQGKMIVADGAIKAGMIDRIGSLEGLIEELNKESKSHNILKGGSFMNAKELKEKHPETHQEILDDGKLEGMLEGETDGITKENTRIKAIEAIDAPGFEDIIAKHKYDSKMTAEKVSAIILEAQKEKRENAAAAHTGDAEELGRKGKDVHQDDDPDEKAEEDAAVKNMVEGAEGK